jgi:hypothetical protein
VVVVVGVVDLMKQDDQNKQNKQTRARQLLTEKKSRPLKFFIHRSKLQAGISEEIQHTDASACLRLLPLHPRRFRSAN